MHKVEKRERVLACVADRSGKTRKKLQIPTRRNVYLTIHAQPHDASQRIPTYIYNFYIMHLNINLYIYIYYLINLYNK